MIWDRERVQWLLDDRLFATQTGWFTPHHDYPAPFDHPFYLLLNVAVGGELVGYPDEGTVFPQRMEVDYVRVYQRD